MRAEKSKCYECCSFLGEETEVKMTFHLFEPVGMAFNVDHVLSHRASSDPCRRIKRDDVGQLKFPGLHKMYKEFCFSKFWFPHQGRQSILMLGGSWSTAYNCKLSLYSAYHEPNQEAAHALL